MRREPDTPSLVQLFADAFRALGAADLPAVISYLDPVDSLVPTFRRIGIDSLHLCPRGLVAIQALPDFTPYGMAPAHRVRNWRLERGGTRATAPRTRRDAAFATARHPMLDGILHEWLQEQRRDEQSAQVLRNIDDHAQPLLEPRGPTAR